MERATVYTGTTRFILYFYVSLFGTFLRFLLIFCAAETSPETREELT